MHEKIYNIKSISPKVDCPTNDLRWPYGTRVFPKKYICIRRNISDLVCSLSFLCGLGFSDKGVKLQKGANSTLLSISSLLY